MIRDGVPAEWIAPKEGVLSWVCGLAITSNAENLDAAYKLINYYASPEAQAISGEQGFVAMNPKALPLMRARVPRERRPGLARDRDPRDPAERRRRSTTAPGRRSPPGERRAAAAAGCRRPASRRSRTAAASARASAAACRGSPASLVIAFAMLILFGPVLMLALFSFNDSSIISLPWEGFTTRWYEEAWTTPEARDAILNSLAGRRRRHRRLAHARHARRLGPDPAAVPRTRRRSPASTARSSSSPG